MNIRIIPRLDIKGPNLVKGVHFEGLRVLGRPEVAARYYAAQGADELIYIDAVASLYGRNSLTDIIRRTAEELFIPLTVGGGLRTVEDMRATLLAGADKIAINSAAVRTPDLIGEGAERFGSQCIVVAIDARWNGTQYEVVVSGGRTPTGLDAIAWAREVEARGAGEILLTSMDRDGTQDGYEIALTRAVSDAVSIPVIASGGAGTLDHFRAALVEGGADAALAASLFHYKRLSVGQVKDYLRDQGVPVRLVEVSHD